jgi:hypothetical protein
LSGQRQPVHCLVSVVGHRHADRAVDILSRERSVFDRIHPVTAAVRIGGIDDRVTG